MAYVPKGLPAFSVSAPPAPIANSEMLLPTRLAAYSVPPSGEIESALGESAGPPIMGKGLPASSVRSPVAGATEKPWIVPAPELAAYR